MIDTAAPSLRPDAPQNRRPAVLRSAGAGINVLGTLTVACGLLSTANPLLADDPTTTDVPTTTVVATSEANWEHLNPARGDKSPSAATLWGDRNGTEATGFLIRPTDGFLSPPHIHNVTYRGVVISGLIHNDDPDATPMWMPAGSFWTQPAGEPHVTASLGEDTMAYIEIDRGPYLVMPVDDAFDRGERPVNVDAANIVWLNGSSTTWINAAADTDDGPEIAFLWGNPQDDEPCGTLVRLPAGYNGVIRSRGATLRAVVIQGLPKYSPNDGGEARPLQPGSYIGSTGATAHRIASGDTGCVIYVRSAGRFVVGEG
ncbi:DUF4437 domain-containing protein [Maioricimonas sp. JC845]|uniref:DUF4437 domain-containing protein n=1 Tax=Maioricimonas sp. JC845 TaxID=3232138 RepID=UPI00345A5C3B